MPIISKAKKDKISEQILHYLFSINPSSAFTNAIAKDTARDEEFVKILLKELEAKNLVVLINKNSIGKEYQRRQRWRLSNEAFEVYKKHQSLNLPAFQAQQKIISKPQIIDNSSIENNNDYKRSYIG